MTDMMQKIKDGKPQLHQHTTEISYHNILTHCMYQHLSVVKH